MNPRRDDVSLRAIQESIVAIKLYARDLDAASSLHLDAIKYQLVVIGEAVNRLSDETRRGAPEIPWARIKSQRNVLVHAYEDVDVPQILAILDFHLGPLERAVVSLLRSSLLSDPLPSVKGDEGGDHANTGTTTPTQAVGHMPGIEEGPIPRSP